MTRNKRGLSGLLALVIVTIYATNAIITTYSKLSHTWDEGTHVSAGLEFLQEGQYTLQTENPPLSRIVLAVIPYLQGARLPLADQRRMEAGRQWLTDVFYRTPQYIRNVTEARVANLLFFWACIGLTWLLAGGLSDPWVSFLSSAAVATLPPIVAHSGFATTDIPFVASYLFVLFSLRRVLNRPSFASASLVGATVGIAIATKFSTLVFLPPTVGAVLVCHYWGRRRTWISELTNRRLWLNLTVITIIAGIAVWGCYGFHIGRLSDLPTQFGPYGEMPNSGWPAFIGDWRIPGHEFLHGLLYLKIHTMVGHRATLFDQFSQRGFLIYYPVILATKTPLPFLIFAVIGLVGLGKHIEDPRKRWFVGLALGALGVLLVSLASPINLGVRHILVIYPLIALASAFGLARLAEQTRRVRLFKWVGAGCIAVQLILLLLTVPHQITYFNVFAGSDPAYISSDSDFDWGQHALALERYFKEHPVPELYILLNGTTRPCELKLPPLKALPLHPVSGWIAVSERNYRLNRGRIRLDPCAVPGSPGPAVDAPPGWLDWLKSYEPVAIIGKTVRLYHIPEPE